MTVVLNPQMQSLLLASLGVPIDGVYMGEDRPIRVPISRDDLPELSTTCGFTKGAEIGVWRGAYSALFCEANPDLHMLCVDPWLSYPEWEDTKNQTVDPKAFMAQSYQDALERLAPFHCTILRQFSVDAAPTIPDRSLDFVFVDGNHSFESVTQDLELWTPKVRSGGFVAGHDYRHFSNKPFIHVIEAVDAYTEAHAIDPWFITATDKTPSFLWVVP